MQKIIILILISMLLISCYEDNSSNETYESYTYSLPVFIGNDSILHLEHFMRQKYIKAGMEEWWVRIKIIDTQGIDISTVWEKNLFEKSTLDYLIVHCIDFAEEAKKIIICHSHSVYGERFLYEVIVMDLDGKIIKQFADKDIENIVNQRLDKGNSVHVSPNCLYYAITNKIKNMTGETVKIISDTIVDWNSNGLLVRNQDAHSEVIDIEGTEYTLYSHPNAHFWFGLDNQYFRIVQDTAIIYNWSNSAVLKKVWLGDYFTYPQEHGFGNPAYIDSDVMSSSISPDLQFFVFSYVGTHLLNLNTGESETIKDASSLPIAR